MLTYMEQLWKRSDAINTTKPSKKEFIPLETQIQHLMASLPESLRRRDWSMADLIARLSGRYRDRPHAMKVAEALRKLGWTRHRDYTREGSGVRVWQHPETKIHQL